jgi:hypothetical protein
MHTCELLLPWTRHVAVLLRLARTHPRDQQRYAVPCACAPQPPTLNSAAAAALAAAGGGCHETRKVRHAAAC